MVERESGTVEDDAPVAPPIPSFESLRAPRRRSAIDLLLPPAGAPAARVVEASEEHRTETPAAAAAPAAASPVEPAVPAAPRPAEWGDLLALGTRMGSCAVRLVAGGLTGLRSLLRG